MDKELLSLGGALALSTGALLLTYSGHRENWAARPKKKPTKEQLERRKKTAQKKQAKKDRLRNRKR